MVFATPLNGLLYLTRNGDFAEGGVGVGGGEGAVGGEEDDDVLG